MAGFERDDVAAILAGVFDVNVKLTDIGDDVRAIRILLEDGDEEEEEEPPEVEDG